MNEHIKKGIDIILIIGCVLACIGAGYLIGKFTGKSELGKIRTELGTAKEELETTTTALDLAISTQRSLRKTIGRLEVELSETGRINRELEYRSREIGEIIQRGINFSGSDQEIISDCIRIVKELREFYLGHQDKEF